jgi:hypothetical protein
MTFFAITTQSLDTESSSIMCSYSLLKACWDKFRRNDKLTICMLRTFLPFKKIFLTIER